MHDKNQGTNSTLIRSIIIFKGLGFFNLNIRWVACFGRHTLEDKAKFSIKWHAYNIRDVEEQIEETETTGDTVKIEGL